MTARRTIDVGHLPVYDISSKAPLFWGQLAVAAIEGTMFCILIAVYFYVRLDLDMWPPPETQLPRTLLPTLALIPLFASALGSYWASEAAKKNDRRGMLLGLTANLVLALLFLVMRWLEWRTFNFRWDADAHASIVWSILSLHTYDVIGDLVFTAVLILIVLLGRAGPKQRQGVHVDSVVWYFLVLIWVPLYVAVYWGPHFAGASK